MWWKIFCELYFIVSNLQNFRPFLVSICFAMYHSLHSSTGQEARVLFLCFSCFWRSILLFLEKHSPAACNLSIRSCLRNKINYLGTWSFYLDLCNMRLRTCKDSLSPMCVLVSHLMRLLSRVFALNSYSPSLHLSTQLLRVLFRYVASLNMFNNAEFKWPYDCLDLSNLVLCLANT